MNEVGPYLDQVVSLVVKTVCPGKTKEHAQHNKCNGHPAAAAALSYSFEWGKSKHVPHSFTASAKLPTVLHACAYVTIATIHPQSQK